MSRSSAPGPYAATMRKCGGPPRFPMRAMRILAPMARNPRRRGDAGWLTFLQAMKNVAI